VSAALEVWMQRLQGESKRVSTLAPVRTDAGKHDRGFAQAAPPPRTRQNDPILRFWRRILMHAVADAKKTKDGLPTDQAILARWWISDYRPKRENPDEWENSFECCCMWLSKDPVDGRKRVLEDIDAALKEAWVQRWYRIVYNQRAAVLSCAGTPTAIARQYILPLVAESTHEETAGIDKPDMFAEEDAE
jgi:hypothetical protein